jgi:hypothetical protein
LQKKRKTALTIHLSRSHQAKKQKSEADGTKSKHLPKNRLGNDLAKAETISKMEFDEESKPKIPNACLLANTNLYTFTDDSGNNFSDKERGAKVNRKAIIQTNPGKDVIVEVYFQTQPPRRKDIEKEFWRNCTDTGKNK